MLQSLSTNDSAIVQAIERLTQPIEWLGVQKLAPHQKKRIAAVQTSFDTVYNWVLFFRVGGDRLPIFQQPDYKALRRAGLWSNDLLSLCEGTLAAMEELGEPIPAQMDNYTALWLLLESEGKVANLQRRLDEEPDKTAIVSELKAQLKRLKAFENPCDPVLTPQNYAFFAAVLKVCQYQVRDSPQTKRIRTAFRKTFYNRFLTSGEEWAGCLERNNNLAVVQQDGDLSYINVKKVKGKSRQKVGVRVVDRVTLLDTLLKTPSETLFPAHQPKIGGVSNDHLARF